MKRFFIAMMVIALMLSLMTGCGGGGAGGGGGGGDNAAPAGNESEDPCSCCPDCVQKECECVECGERDICECKMPRGGGPLTYDIAIETEYWDQDPTCPFPDECGIVSNSSAKVTMEWDDSRNGYFGTSQDGVGEYLHFGSHYWDSLGHEILGHASPGTTFKFSAMLDIPDAGKDGVIRVGLDFSGEDEVTMNWSNGEVLPFWGMMGMIHGWFSGTYTMLGKEMDTSGILDPGTFEYDKDLGMFILELPLKDGDIQKTFEWSRGLSMTITLTPAK